MSGNPSARRDGLRHVRRCATCVMPDSTPGSQFDAGGRCIWCRINFPGYVPRGTAAFEELLRSRRGQHGAPDAIVGVSGGKDSSYVLLQLRRKYRLNVEALTYVHDGSAPSAVENARRACAALEVRQHVVELSNHRHLRTFQQFFEVWLHSQNPLAAAMTCVACKHLHLMATRIAARRGIPLAIWSASPLETPPFIPSQPPAEQAGINAPTRSFGSMALTLLRNLGSPRFGLTFVSHCRTCVPGCLAFTPEAPFLGRWYRGVQQVQYFDYERWDGNAIRAAVQRDLGWAPPGAGQPDWHSDCLFNVFKEYMFQAMYGVSYTDAFLSNQIRVGLITRERAYDELLESKRHYAEALLHAVEAAEIGHLREQIDTACFAVS